MQTGRHVVMLCTAARGGMRSVVEGYRNDGLFDRWSVRLIETHDEGGMARRLGLAARGLASFAAQIARHQVLLVHIHVAMKGSFWRKSLFVLIAKAAGVPIVLHLHGSEFADFHAAQPKPIRALIGKIFAMATVVLVLSDRWARFIRRISPDARVEILPNYVAMPDPIQPTAEADVLFLFLGLIGKRKGVYDLLPAFRDTLSAEPSLRLIIGGNGEEEQARAMALSLGIASHVEFAGWVTGAAKLALLARADVFVLPSHNEGLPMSILEAMSWSKPIISTEVGGIPELVRDGIDGLIFAAGDISALTSALITLGQDRNARLRMGASARERVRACYSRDAVMPRLEAIYADLAR